MKISIIGAGNVATHLGIALDAAGFEICEVFSREIAHALAITKDLYNGKATNELNFSDSEARFFILAVSDDAIASVAEQLVLPEDSILAHTSGSFPLAELSRLMLVHHDLPVETAVFYPLMTFSKSVSLDFKKTPLCIEATKESIATILIEIGKKIRNVVYTVNTAERKTLHLAAVFSCNFTNHLFSLAKEILDENDLEFAMLEPLIKATVAKALRSEHPADVQTGPAVRGDEQTIKAHLKLLNDNKDLTKIYQTMTQSIQDWHDA
jgi:predicted short-subunit dehydrogenase-like oxidoreductase (DUF2520 family)